MKCPTCGEDVPADESLCPRDGTVVQPTELQAPEETTDSTQQLVGPYWLPLDTELEARERTAEHQTQTQTAIVQQPEYLQTLRDEVKSQDPLVGQRLGDYIVEGRLGDGGMGIVYEGMHAEIGKRVAIKVMRPEVTTETNAGHQLLTEARAVNAIGHANIVDIFGIGRLPDGREYIVMELLSGQGLDGLLADRVKLPASEVLDIMDEVLAALEAAHGAGVIHRDLKPANVFLAEEKDGGRKVKLLDFGTAKQSPGPGALADQTGKGRVVGTPQYMAPEQGCGDPVSPRTDLYALGAMAYEMLTGRPPFTGPSHFRILMKHLEEDPQPPSRLEPTIPHALEVLILQLLAKEPQDRPESAAHVRAALRRMRAGPGPLPVLEAPVPAEVATRRMERVAAQRESWKKSVARAIAQFAAWLSRS